MCALCRYITSTYVLSTSQARAASHGAGSCSRVCARCVRQVRRRGPDHWNFYIPAASTCRTSQESTGLPSLVVRGRPCRAGASLIVLATFAGALAPVLAVPPTVPPTTPPAAPTAEPNAVPNAAQYAAPTITSTAAPTAATPRSQPTCHHRRLLACHRPLRWAGRATGAARPTCRRYRRQRRHDRQYHRRRRCRRCRRRRRRRRRRCPRRLFLSPPTSPQPTAAHAASATANRCTDRRPPPRRLHAERRTDRRADRRADRRNDHRNDRRNDHSPEHVRRCQPSPPPATAHRAGLPAPSPPAPPAPAVTVGTFAITSVAIANTTISASSMPRLPRAHLRHAHRSCGLPVVLLRRIVSSARRPSR